MSDSDPFLPEDYSMVIMNSLAASCAFRALYYSLESKTPEERDAIMSKILKSWREVWAAKFQEDMAMYTKLLGDGRVEGAVNQLTSPEEFQSQFNRTIKEVEDSARAALWPENTKS